MRDGGGMEENKENKIGMQTIYVVPSNTNPF
jgi:hypothetical protein